MLEYVPNLSRYLSHRNVSVPAWVLYAIAHLQYKVWVKPSAELSFLYGNNVLKAGLGRITQDSPQNQGVVVYSMSDIPLGTLLLP